MNTPTVTYDCDTGQWTLENTVEVLGVLVPAGFTFDLASIPRLLWPIIGPFELSIEAPLLHDYLYRNGGLGTFSRADVDAMFLDLMRSEEVARWRRWAAWLAVRLFGWAAWKEVDLG
jgi:hypothetical protein